MSHHILDHIIDVTSARPCGRDRWMGHGICHGSEKNRDLSIRKTEDRILLHDFTGCEFLTICRALGIEPAQLFLDASRPRGSRLTLKPIRANRRRTALDFELHADKLNERVEAVLRAASGLDTTGWTDHDFDAVMQAVSQAYHDREQARVLFAVADSQREKAFHEEQRK